MTRAILATALAHLSLAQQFYPAIVDVCQAGAPTQAFDLSTQYGGVISTTGLDSCLCSLPNDAPGALSFQRCDGPGKELHNREVGYNFSGTGAIPKTGTGLCAAVLTAAAGDAVVLAPCAPGAETQRWTYNDTSKAISSAANASLCLAAGPTPLPLLSNVFGSYMVLQRGIPVQLWGWTSPGGAVTVQFVGANITSAPAGADGRWSVSLPAMPATAGGGPGYNISVVDGTSGAAALLAGVLFGDVVWCSGQSNLSGGNTPVSYAFNATAEVAAAALYPWVRVFAVGTASQGAPQPLPQLAFPPHIPWAVAAPASVGPFSATCWFHGRGLADALGPDVPLGLVESAWGGTSIQAWAPPGVVQRCGDFPPYPGGWPTATSSLWNSMTAPFGGMRVSGLVWYQGESNALASEAENGYYDCALPFLLAGLRGLFESPDAYAGVVQLAPWASSAAGFNAQVAALRQAQLAACDALPNATAITAVDGGDPYGPIGSIHPRAKQLVGRRLAAAALTSRYGRPAPFAGPRYAAARDGGGSPATALSATVTFAPPTPASPGNDGPLVLVAPSPVGPLANSSVCPVGVDASLCAGFAVRGSDGAWFPASAAVGGGDGRTLVLTAAGTGVPAGLTATGTASGWSLWPVTLLYSGAGLPAFPWNASFGA